MSVMVSARIPTDLRDQANTMLKERGLTPTALINAAYEGFVREGELPYTGDSSKARADRVITPELARKLRASVRASTVQVPEDFPSGQSYDDRLRAVLSEKHRK
ncbi:MAG: hypothetical protein PUE02_06775 [Eggerthellaceae bacterium]|nr:hypothetical protein [Eggerthellaceae bacterium]